jgi:tetratricopeptide (TPR) repeat protein
LYFQSQYKEAVEQSTKALELNPTYVKALVRRAQAHEKLDQLDEALIGLVIIFSFAKEYFSTFAILNCVPSVSYPWRTYSSYMNDRKLFCHV